MLEECEKGHHALIGYANLCDLSVQLSSTTFPHLFFSLCQKQHTQGLMACLWFLSLVRLQKVGHVLRKRANL